MEIDPKIELHIKEKHEELSKENAKLFSAKWVEKAFTGVLYFIGMAVVGALLVSIGLK